MNYILMHKTYKVVELHIDETTVSIIGIGAVFCMERLPIGVSILHGIPNREDLNDWWFGRSIPASRQNLTEALSVLGVSSPHKLILQCFGLSLSDQYWVNPMVDGFTWERINFYTNVFSEDIGNAFFRENNKTRQVHLNQVISAYQWNLKSPDNTSDGWLKKRWKIIDGSRYLMKAGSDPYHQQPINEAFASIIMKRLDVPHVSYSVIYDDQLPYSICKNFVNENTELVTAFQIHNTLRIQDATDLYSHFVKCCQNLGIPDVIHKIDQMLVVDYLIGNYDRHMNNFGAIRDVNTLEWISIAPMYDNGSSLWNDVATFQIDAVKPMKSQPFRNHHEDQIKLVRSFDWVNWKALDGVEEEFNELLKASRYISNQRRDLLCQSLRERICYIKRNVN